MLFTLGFFSFILHIPIDKNTKNCCYYVNLYSKYVKAGMTMSVNEHLVSYLEKEYGNIESIADILKDNSLYFLVGNLFGIDIKKPFLGTINKLYYKSFVKKLCDIWDLFSSANIDAILLKGIALAEKLYDAPHDRCLGDIDIFVKKEHFSSALTVLIRAGYDFHDNNTINNEHHIVLVKDDITVELHRSVYNPILEIDEKYLLDNIALFSFDQYMVQTFNITATLLHLIYHLYQDTYWSHYSLHSVLNNVKVPTTKRFLYRVYEIALFSEKYHDEIKWDDIIENLKYQRFRVFFKKMIYDIVNIFPDAFPDRYLQAVNSMEYIDDDHDIWCKRLLSPEYNHQDIVGILCGFIDEYWEKRSDKNIHIRTGEGFSLDKPFVKGYKGQQKYELSCDVSTEKVDEGLKLKFVVSNNDFCFTEIGNYDTKASDGIHLMLFGTEKYSYNSIYVFPKIINGVATAIPIDVKASEWVALDKSLIDASCEYTDRDYTITMLLKDKFLQENGLSKYLYMGLVIVDCSPETRKRKAELVLADTYSEWYNPTYFAKVDIT